MLLYHGTNTKRLPSIRKKGLIITAPKASSGEDYVYLTDKPEVAAMFSGYGKDSQGFAREGYMTPMEAKKQTGVILKVKIDPKFLEKDQIWEKKKEEISDTKKTYDTIYKSILDDYEKGNQILEFYIEKELFKLYKESGMEEDGEEYDPDAMPEEYLQEAVKNVVTKEAQKEFDALMKESKRYTIGKLYQYSKDIPPDDIIEELPAKQFLKTDIDTKEFGNKVVEDIFASTNTKFLVKALKRIISKHKLVTQKRSYKKVKASNPFMQNLNDAFAKIMRNPSFQKKVISDAKEYSEGMSEDEVLERAFEEIYPKWMKDLEKRGEFENNGLWVYRGISAKTKEDIKHTKLGIYWTWDKSKAKNYSNINTAMPLQVISALVSIDDIDIAQTLQKIVWAGYQFEESEREITLIKGRNIKVRGYDQKSTANAVITAQEIPTVSIPKGSYLFHGTLEEFSGDLKPGGYDKLIWFSDTPKIAQLYIPKSGMTTYISAEDLIRPSKDKIDQAIQKMIGIEYDMSKVEWEGNRLKSWPSPIGWDKLPKEADVKKAMEKLGFKDDFGRYTLRIGRNKILKPDEVQKGRLYIAKVKEPLTLWRKSKGEGDLMDLQYHDLSGFEAARAMGVDGVLIDDFVKSEEYGSFGHLSVGLYDSKKLDITSIPAEYREWDYKPKGTPEYPNPPEMFLHKL